MRKKRFGSFLFLLFFVLCTLACEKKTGSQTVDGNLVIVKIGNSRITVKELERKYNTMPQQYKMFFTGEDGKKKFLNEIIKEKLLAEKARNLGMDKKEEVKVIIEDLTNNILAKEMFSIKNEELMKSAKVTDEEIEKEIKENNSVASASHILVKDEAKAKEILKRVKKGEDFQKLAVEFSEDPSVKNNKGDLGTFSKGDMVPEFDNAIFLLKIGEIAAEPVKTSYGFHVIKRVEPDKEQIKSRLVNKKQNETLDNWLEELKKEISVEISEEVLGKVKFEDAQSMQGNMPGMPQGHGAGGGKAMPSGHGGM